MNNILNMVYEANLTRSHANLNRRLIKILEEVGEVSEAYLNSTTSGVNGKNKTWDDVREEVADVLIVSYDIALTPLGDEDSTIFRNFPTDTFELGDFSNFENVLIDVSVAATSAFKNLHEKKYFAARWDMINLIANSFKLACIVLPDQLSHSKDDIRNDLTSEVERKLTKWKNNRAKMVSVTDDI